jgi:hypothetical protein
VPTSNAENVREFYRRQGEEREQQRIVHLLEDMLVTALETETSQGTQTAWVIQNALALIKKGKLNVQV